MSPAKSCLDRSCTCVYSPLLRPLPLTTPQTTAPRPFHHTTHNSTKLLPLVYLIPSCTFHSLISYSAFSTLTDDPLFPPLLSPSSLSALHLTTPTHPSSHHSPLSLPITPLTPIHTTPSLTPLLLTTPPHQLLTTPHHSPHLLTTPSPPPHRPLTTPPLPTPSPPHLTTPPHYS